LELSKQLTGNQGTPNHKLSTKEKTAKFKEDSKRKQQWGYVIIDGKNLEETHKPWEFGRLSMRKS